MKRSALICLVFALFAISVVSAATVPQEGLVAHYDFNDGSGNILSDKVGGYDGNLTNMGAVNAWSNDAIQGSALQFDGFDDYVLLPDYVGYGNSEVSTFVWFKFTGDTTEGWQVLMGGSELEINYADEIIGRTGGTNQHHPKVPMAFHNVAGVKQQMWGEEAVLSKAVIDDGNWHHMGFTFDGVTMKGYFDGVHQTTWDKTFNTDVKDSFSSRTIGSKGTDTGSAGNYFVANALIDEATIYDRALTAGEVTQLFDAKGDIESSSLGDVGESCADNSDCLGDLYCGSMYTCSSGALGEACPDLFPGSCQDNLYCGFTSNECEDCSSANGNAFCYEDFDCNSGICNDNKCTVPPACESSANTCIDTDNGIDYLVKSYLTGEYSWIDGNTYPLVDSPETCQKDANGVSKILWEGYCDNGELKFEEYTCPNRCIGGACVDPIAPECRQGDLSNDYEAQDYATLCDEWGQCDTVLDTCKDQDTIQEYFCEGAERWVWEYDCPGGCEGGSCVNDIFTAWSCDLEPARCPIESVQEQTCTRTNEVTLEEEVRVQTVDCNPGECSGCEVVSGYGSNCYGFGEIVSGNRYCGLDKLLHPRNAAEISCTNDFECESNVCTNGACFDLDKHIEEFGFFKANFVNAVCAITTSAPFNLDTDKGDCIAKRFTEGGSLEDGRLEE